MSEPNPMTAAPEKRGFLAAWSYPQYRFLFISSLGTYTGRWIETAIGAWLILELTDSPFLVGLLGASRFASMLLGPLCGTIADRLNRRLILIAVQAVYATGALVIAALFFTARIEVWHLFAFTIVAGICYTFDYSSRHAVAADIVKREHLVAAVSLLFVLTGVTATFGPLLGGNLLDVIGAGGCFALISVGFLFSLVMLLPMKITAQFRPGAQESMWQHLHDGFLYIKKDRSLAALILIAALVNLFIFPYWFTLIPVFARDVLHTGAGGYGQLMAAIGLGSIIGPLFMASLPGHVSKGRLLFVVSIAWPAILMVFTASRLFALSLSLLVFTGMVQGMSMALIQSLLLLWSSAEMRGRVSGARAFAIGTMPLGNLLAGAGAGFLGAPATLLISTSTAVVLIVFIAIWAREIFKRG
jgi:MFS family permease